MRGFNFLPNYLDRIAGHCIRYGDDHPTWLLARKTRTRRQMTLLPDADIRATLAQSDAVAGCRGGGALEQSGEYSIQAPRQRVWEALNDPAILRQCIEGCRRFEALGEDRFATEIRAKVGPVRATFKGTVSLVDAKPPESYGLELAIDSGPVGFGKGMAWVTLAETDQGTLLRYAAAGTVGGKLAQIGQRLIDAAARKTADGFFATFAGLVGISSGKGEDTGAIVGCDAHS